MKRSMNFLKTALIGVALAVVAWGCSSDVATVQAEDSPATKSVAVENTIPDTVFLGFEGDLNDPEVI